MSRPAHTGLRRVVAVAVMLTALVATAGQAWASDGIRALQWALPYLDASAAWQISRGAGVTVAVLDSGVVTTRPDLVGQVTTGPDYVGGGGSPGDGTWGAHGTAMASIIAGHGNGVGGSDGVMGIAPSAHLLSVRVIRDDQSSERSAPTRNTDPLAAGINYAVAHGASVINMSLGGASQPTTDSPVAAAIRNAIAHDVVVVAAAGNDAQQGDAAEIPAALPGVIGVGAVDSRGMWAPFSTYGWEVTIAAPGVDVVTDAPDHDYYRMDGTSPACAYVAGVVALIRSARPRLSPAQIETLLERTATDRPAGGRDDRVGYGVVDPLAALRAASGLAAAPTVPTPVGYRGPAHFGAGPTIVVHTGGSPLSSDVRALVNSLLGLLACWLTGVLVLYLGRRHARAHRGGARDGPSTP